MAQTTLVDIRAYFIGLKDHRVIPFYSHKPHAYLKEFSNFHKCDYLFNVPNCCWREDYPGGFRSVPVCCSEQAIMICKALLMGDLESVNKIIASKSPTAIKKLGRQVTPWNQQKWNDNVCEIAYEAVVQKFLKCNDLQRILRSTGDAIIAEATVTDRNWAIGLATTDPAVSDVTKWRGDNILGWALMQARDRLH